MEQIGNLELFFLVLKASLMFYALKYSCKGVFHLYFIYKKERAPSLTATIDDMYFRQLDSNALLEEIHAILAGRIKPDEIETIRAAMGREGGDDRLSEILFFRNYLRHHRSPSELEDFLHEIKRHENKHSRKVILEKFAECRAENKNGEREYPWEQLFLKDDKVIKNREL